MEDEAYAAAPSAEFMAERMRWYETQAALNRIHHLISPFRFTLPERVGRHQANLNRAWGECSIRMARGG